MCRELTSAFPAAFGTALVAAVIFSSLSSTDSLAAKTFGELLLHGPRILEDLPASVRAAMTTEIQTAFRLTFLLIACFAATISMIACTIPMRRV